MISAIFRIMSISLIIFQNLHDTIEKDQKTVI